jgi:hypothetical protein
VGVGVGVGWDENRRVSLGVASGDSKRGENTTKASIVLMSAHWREFRWV